jgi:hypothetical protein
MSQTSTLVDTREYELGGDRLSYRYMTNAVGWLLHDTIVHPLTGIVGFAGRLCWSMRLMALSHHMHNVTAPNNDMLADYVEALQRAGKNETYAPTYTTAASRPSGHKHKYIHLRTEGRWDCFFCEGCVSYQWVDPATGATRTARPPAHDVDDRLPTTRPVQDT